MISKLSHVGRHINVFNSSIGVTFHFSHTSTDIFTFLILHFQTHQQSLGLHIISFKPVQQPMTFTFSISCFQKCHTSSDISTFWIIPSVSHNFAAIPATCSQFWYHDVKLIQNRRNVNAFWITPSVSRLAGYSKNVYTSIEWFKNISDILISNMLHDFNISDIMISTSVTRLLNYEHFLDSIGVTFHFTCLSITSLNILGHFDVFWITPWVSRVAGHSTRT